MSYAIANVVPKHLQEVRARRLGWIEKTRAAVKDRLTKEIGYWDHRAEELKIQEQTGRINARLNSQEARRRADDLQARIQWRIEELNLESQISALPPVVLGGMVVVPQGLLMAMKGRTAVQITQADTQASATRARSIIMEIERGLGFEPIDREFEKLVPCNIIYFVESKSMIYWRQLNEGGCYVAKISSNTDQGGAQRT